MRLSVVAHALSLVAVRGGCSLVVVRGFLSAVVSLVAAWVPGLQ